ncbi:hypothetical protein QTN25_010524 [Entamoeba marina]
MSEKRKRRSNEPRKPPRPPQKDEKYEVIKVNRINEIKKIEGSDAEREMKIAKKNYELSQQKQSEHYSCEFLLNGKWCLIETDNCSPCKNIKKLLLGGITEYLKDKYKIDLGFRKTTVGDKRIIDGSVIVDEINNFRFKIDSNQGLISLYPNPSNEKQQYIFEPKNVLSVISDVYGCKKIQSTPSSQSSKDIDDNSNQPNAEDLMDIDDNSNQPNAEQLMDIDDNSSQSHTEKLIHQQPISFDGTSCTRPNASLNEANSPSPLYTMHNDGKQGVYPNATINEGECDFFKSFEKGKINEQEGTNGFINGTGNKVIWISDKNFQNHEIPSQPLSVATIQKFHCQEIIEKDFFS